MHSLLLNIIQTFVNKICLKKPKQFKLRASHASEFGLVLACGSSDGSISVISSAG
jgi:hypothetical protein